MPYSIIAKQSGGADVLVKQNFELKKPKKGMVLLSQTAIGVNFIDIYFRNGAYPWPQTENLILGSEAAGIVEEIGEDVVGLNVGDRVAYTIPNHAYTTHRTIDAKHLVKIPDGVSDQVAAASILKGLTAYYLLHDSFKVKSGQDILFHAAAGGVGLIAGQWLANKGCKVIGTAGGAEKCKMASQYGYSEMIDYSSEDFVERVKELTEGKGVDAVYDSVGQDTYPGSLNCLKTFGTMISFGQSSGAVTGFKISDLAAGSYSLTRPSLFHFTQNRDWLEKASAALFEAIIQKKINVMINQTFDLENVADAHRQMEARKTTGCTILLP